LVADSAGSLQLASNLSDVAYLEPGDPVSSLLNDSNYISGNQFQPPVNPAPPGLPDSPPAGQVFPAGWIEFDIGMGPMYLPVYQ